MASLRRNLHGYGIPYCACVSAIVVLAIFGAGNTGTREALRVTARWSFLLFWGAYVGSAMAKGFGPRFDRLGRRGRELGLSFASFTF